MLPSRKELTAGDDASPERTVLILHGILGRGNNWRSFARRFVRAHPRWSALLVDLRAHGESRDLPGPDDVETAARDLERVRAVHPRPIEAVVAHSFGGKVALAYSLLTEHVPRDLISIDSLPAARPGREGSESTLRVLEVLRGLPEVFASRDEFVRHLLGQGLLEGHARWLAQNLERTDGGALRFGLSIDRIEALLEDYFSRDLSSAIDPPRDPMVVHLVIGGRSPVFSAEDRAHARELERRHAGRVHTHVLEDANHWVHMDDPAGLNRIVDAALGEGEAT